MFSLSQKQQKIVAIFLKNNTLSSSMVHAEMAKSGEGVSLVTVKRILSDMAVMGALKVIGSGRSTSYAVSALGRIFAEINAKEYCVAEPDRRYGLHQYNFDLLPAFPAQIFSEKELEMLECSTAAYRQSTRDLSETLQKKELERLIIELAWKSSKIEGNTYTLLDTEKLILENKAAEGKTKDETQMILNHKDAFNFIRENKKQFKIMNRMNLEELHSILVKDLNVGQGLRKKPVGVLGSLYRPLDNIHQITDAIEVLGKKILQISSAYVKAFVALAGLAYIQPFEDGNKRTGRLMANALLLAYDLAPLSYRSVDESDYREAMLVFYELNSVIPLKKIFLDQYDFAARNYAVK
ncbi:MAG: Fic family protein [Patescibacteria group bacterium]